jgi:hypothetical protein
MGILIKVRQSERGSSMRKAWKLLQGEGEENIQEGSRRKIERKFSTFTETPRRLSQSEEEKEAQSCIPE